MSTIVSPSSIDAIIPHLPQIEVVFLDFDGVLNNESSFKRGHTELFNNRPVTSLDPENVTAFTTWLQSRPHMGIVISSTWRVHHEFDELVERLAGMGVPADRIVGRTSGYVASEAQDWRSCERGLEIAHWLRQHADRHDCYPDIVIVDDLWASEFGPLSRHLVQTSQAHGFEAKHGHKADKLLREFPFDPARLPAIP